MMKKIILSLGVLSLSISGLYAGWNTQTDINASTTGVVAEKFLKVYGSNTLKINEIIRINPYADIDQVIDPNNGVTTFTLTYEDGCNWDRCVVDGITYSFIGSRYYGKKYSHRGNTLRMRTRDNPSIEDNLQAKKVVEKEYFYDDQGPVCRNEGFYKTVDRSDGSVEYDGGWINYNLYYNLQCIDSYDGIDGSGCKTDFGDSVEDRDSGVFKKMSLSKITHGVIPFSGFGDNVGNISDNGTSGGAPRCEPSNIDFVPKVDKQFPVLSPSGITLSEYPDGTGIVTVIDNFDIDAKIRVINKKIDVLSEPSDDIFEFIRKDVSFLAGPKYVSIDFIDSAALNPDLTPGSDGSSGIQDYSFHLKRIGVFPDEESVISPAVDICEETGHGVLNNDLTVALMKESISGLDCTDVSGDSSDRGIQKAGKYQYTITMLDYAGNTTIINGDFIVYPADVNSSNSSVVMIPNTDGANGQDGQDSKLANNSDYYSYEIELQDTYGNLVHEQEYTVYFDRTSTGNSDIFLNQDSGTSTSLVISQTNTNLTELGIGEDIRVSSYAPGEFTEMFDIRVPKWDDNYVEIPGSEDVVYISTSVTNTFQRLFKGTLGIDDGELNILEPEIIKIDIEKNSGGVPAHIVNEFKNTLVLDNSDFRFESGNDRLNEVGLSGNSSTLATPQLNATVEYIGGGTVGATGLTTDPWISYSLGSKDIYVKLSGSLDWTDETDLNIVSSEFFGIEIEGGISGIGDSSTSLSTSENFANLNKIELKSSIRNEANRLTKGMDDGEKINGVLYIEGNSTPIDYTSLNLSAGETLVLKNGNLTINDNINDLVGLIITKDDFGDDDIGNIYIESDITDINAGIFADGSLISVKYDGNQFDINDTSRNDELVRQLRIKGALFTKNTIGGAIDDGGEYEKFGGEKTSNYWTALTYDLNLLRSGNLEANGVDVVTVKPEYSVVITYDSGIMNGVLKGFTK